jgi:hypothetical protein
MTVSRWIQRSIPLAAATLVGAAPMVFAQGSQGQEVFEWSGRVDREVQITMRGNQLYTEKIGYTEPGRARSRVFAQLPRREGQLVVQTLNGRGNVDVVQQPSSENGYTAIVRIRDPRSGSDDYRLAGYWESYSYSNGEVYGRGRGIGRGRGRGQDAGNDDRNGGYNNRDIPVNPNGQYGQYGDRTMLHWSGNVDDQLEIRIQGNRVDYRTLSGSQPTSVRSDRANLAMPRQGAQVSVIQNQGRGQVWVVEQPTSLNGYTTVLRIRDPQSGSGFYDFNLMWQ